jgi:hypothetical protein
MGANYLNLSNNKATVSFDVIEILPNVIREIGSNIKSIFSDITGNILNTDLEYVIVSKASANLQIQFYPDDIEVLKNQYENQIGSDSDALSGHPIFKLASVPNPSLRFQNYPVSGVYPDDIKGTKDVFDGINFSKYNNFEVDNEGRVFLKGLDSKDNIYVRKNSNKKVFGYFPYLPNCEE